MWQKGQLPHVYQIQKQEVQQEKRHNFKRVCATTRILYRQGSLTLKEQELLVLPKALHRTPEKAKRKGKKEIIISTSFSSFHVFT